MRNFRLRFFIVFVTLILSLMSFSNVDGKYVATTKPLKLDLDVLANFNITFDSNGGTFDTEDLDESFLDVTSTSITKKIAADRPVGILPVPTRQNYVFAGWHKTREDANGVLPTAYQQVEYIESTGTQFIDTGDKFTDGYKYEVKITPTGNTAGVMFGANSSNGSESMVFYTTTYMYFAGSSKNYGAPVVGQDYVFIFDATTSPKTLKMNGETILSGSNSLNNKEVYLFGGISNAGSVKIDCKNKQKIYYYRLYYKNELIKELIPCFKVETGEAGLYDVVNGAFYRNGGTDSFIAGPTNSIIETTISNERQETTYYASWTPERYTLYLDENKEEGTTGEITGNFVDGKMMIFYGGSYARLPELQRPGYIFDGWYTKASGGDKVNKSDTHNVNEDKTLYAHWTARKYNIHFYDIGGEYTGLVKQVTYDGTYGDLPVPKKIGYKFLGWSKTISMDDYQQVEYLRSDGNQYIDTGLTLSNGYRFDFKSSIQANCNMMFGSNSSGSEVMVFYGATHYLTSAISDVQAVLNKVYNVSVDLLSSPKRLIIDDELKGERNGNPNGYGANLFCGASSGTINTYNKQTYYEFKAYDKDGIIRYMLPCIRKVDNVAGMYDVINDTFYVNKKADGTDFAYGNNVIVTYEDKDSAVSVNSDIDLFANWEKINYDVLFDSNGGILTSPTEVNETWKNVTDTTATKTLTQGDLYGELPVTTRQGYEFDGWYNSIIAGKYTPVEYIESDGNAYIDTEWSPNGKSDVTIKAKASWNGSGWGVLFGAATAEAGPWYNCAMGLNGSNRIWHHVCNSENICEYSIVANKVYDIEYKYSPKTLKLNVGGESKEFTNLNDKLTSATLSVMAGTYGKEHKYYFHGKLYAFSIEDESGLVYDMVPVKDKDGNYGLYDKVNNDFYPSNGTSSFKGGNEVSASKEITSSLAFSADEYSAVYANWIPETYSIVLKDNGEGEYTEYQTIEVTYDGKYTDLPILYRTGSIFLGWYDALTDGNKYEPSDIVKITEDKVFYAIWKQKDFTLTFDTNGGEELSSSSKTIHYGEEFGELPTPIRTGYSLIGWSRNKEQVTYYPVEYIESHGSEYIEIPWSPYGKDNVTIEVGVSWNGSGWGVVFGAANYGDTIWFNEAIGNNRLWHHVCNSGDICTYKINKDTRYDITYRYTKNKLKVSVDGFADTEGNLNGNVVDYNLGILKGNYGNDYRSGLDGKLYGFKLYEGEDLLFDLIPVKREDGVYGLYDLVKDEFYGNKGSGNFTGGEIGESSISSIVTSETKLLSENNVTIYALWNKDVYTVNLYDVVEGEYKNTDSFTIGYGDEITELTAPSRTGYKFIGWYDALTDGNLYDNTDTYELTSGVSLYAIYEPIKYTINYHTINSIEELFGYQQVEYLESLGNEYINVELESSFTEDWSFEMKFESNDNVTWFLGSVSSAGSSGDFGISKTDVRFGSQFYKGEDFSSGIHEITVNSNGYIVDGVSKDWEGEPTLNVGNTIQIFRANNSSAGQGGRIYYLRLYKDGDLKYDFVPCFRTSDNERGLFDLCHKTFYPNKSGMGKFAIGDEIISENKTSKEYKYDEQIEILDSGYDSFTYDLLEWNSKEDGSGVSYEPKQKVKNLTSVDETQIDLYGMLTRKNFTIKYASNISNNNLPSEYKELTYIESPSDATSTNAYIDTLIAPKNGLGMYIKFKCNSSTNWIVGSVNTSGNVADFGIAKNTIRYGTQYVKDLSLNDGNIHEVYVDKLGYSIDGVETSWSQEANMDCSKSLFLFFANGSSATRGGIIYNIKLYMNGELTNEFIPAIKASDNKLGLYDKENDHFYPKTSGSIDFIGEDMKDYFVTRNNSMTLPSVAYEREGYHFVCWNTKADGTGISYNDGESVDNIITRAGTVYLYAIWEKDE